MAKSKRGKHEEHENHERWLVSYADFITLLFAFFVVLYAASNKNEEKEKQFEESIRQELKMASMGGAGSGGAGGSASGSVSSVVNPIDPVEAIRPRDSGARDMAEDVEKALESQMQSEEKNKMITDIRHDAVGVRVSMAATELFPVGSAKLRASSIESLGKLASILRRTQRQIIIEGHTDDTPVVGGQFESNWELAAARATQVVRFLVKVHGFDPAKLAAISYADQRPVASNATEQGRSQNRRIEFLIANDSPTN